MLPPFTYRLGVTYCPSLDRLVTTIDGSPVDCPPSVSLLDEVVLRSMAEAQGLHAGGPAARDWVVEPVVEIPFEPQRPFIRDDHGLRDAAHAEALSTPIEIEFDDPWFEVEPPTEE